jgi:hypothetical protein
MKSYYVVGLMFDAITIPEDWCYFLEMDGIENGDQGRADGAFHVDFFWSRGEIDRLRCETEEVEAHFVHRVMAGDLFTLENIPWVVGLAIDSIRDGRPAFTTAKYY